MQRKFDNDFGRGGGYFEPYLPDLLQLLTLLAMERPGSFSAEDIHNEEVRDHCQWTLVRSLYLKLTSDL
jgi:hypothetical protein